MREVRVFIDAPLTSSAQLRLPIAAARHVARVLRLRVESPLTVFDGRGGEYAAKIIQIRGDQVDIATDHHRAIERESSRPLVLLQGISRGERMDLVVQKATELGVTHILPVSCQRSVVQLDNERAEKRVAHWRSIAISACEQCGRNRLPVIEPAKSLSEAIHRLAALDAHGIRLRALLDPDASQSLAQWLRSADPAEGIALLIGPEGGLDSSESELARAQQFASIRLGPRILRTETAAFAALAAIQSLAGDFL